MQLVGSVLFGADEMVAEYVRTRIPHMRDKPFAKFTALGVVRNNTLIGGIVYTNYRGFDIEMSGAFSDPAWCHPKTVGTLLTYPYDQLGCVRTTMMTGKRNKRARRITHGLGFKLEGVARKGLDGIEDAYVYSMLREECWWINRDAPCPPIVQRMLTRRTAQESLDGKISPSASAAA